MRKIIIMVLGMVLAMPAYAQCDLKKIKLGGNIRKLAMEYNLDMIGGRDSGRIEVSRRGKGICKDLSIKSQINFLFVEKKLVHFEVKDSDSDLLKIAENNFGLLEDRNNGAHPDKDKFDYVWGDDESYVAVYSARKNAHKTTKKITVTSKKYKKLLDKSFNIESEK